ncbi:MAG: DNA-binding transcriptional LysR family regulator [Candidatus Poriferisodalaceae bacterium]|jgi:DNA-binding transcriptional LysR family regulator
MEETVIRNLRCLTTFVQVVDSGSLSAAARTIGLTLPMVSRDVAHLEDDLGVVLLQRTTRHLSVTDEGNAFYARARHIITELAEAEDEIRPSNTSVRGTVRLTLPTITVPFGLADSLTGLMTDNPELRVQIDITDDPSDLVGGGFDIGLYFGSPPESSHTVTYLTRAAALMAAAPAYVERKGLPTHPEELRHHECLRFVSDRTQTSWRLTGPNGQPSDWTVAGRLEITNSSGLASAMRAGLGIGITSSEMLKTATEQNELVRVLPDWTWAELPIYALIPAGRQTLPRVRLVLDWLREYSTTAFG